MLKFTRALFFIAFTLIAPASAIAADINISEQLKEGGIALICIVLMSILMLAVVTERLVNFRAKNIFPNDLLARIGPLRQAEDFEKIEEVLALENNTLSHILHYLLLNRQRTAVSLVSGASEIASLELRQHQQKAYALAIVATVAPIVGLLGTVIGMIEAFHVIAYSQGMGNPALLAGGISKALINTAAGLSVALPALAMHHFFKHRCVVFGLQLEQTINQLVGEWFSESNETSAPQKETQVIYAN